MNKLHKKAEKHLRGDIKGYKHEIAEDKELIKDFKMAAKKSKKKAGTKHKSEKRRGEEKREPKSEKKFEKVMKEYKSGKLHSGSKKGPEVTNPKQALAIAFSEAKRAKRKKKK